MKREYPANPIVGVGAVIIRKGEILLVRRGSDPEKNRWTIPGGMVELGETVREAIIREVREETSLNVEIDGLIDVVDILEPDENGKLRYHFVIVDFLVHLKGGTLRSGSDVQDVRWVSLDEVEDNQITNTFREFFRRNQRLLRELAAGQKTKLASTK